jgi:DNA-binding MarR family transcriptional regulator
MKNDFESLRLENQICFPIYATSRLLTKIYRIFLQDIDLTYPQYLVLLVLWEKDHQSVSTISEQLLLESNTLTPLLKRMEEKKLVRRERSREDERVVMISLTEAGRDLKEKAVCIPDKIVRELDNGQLGEAEVLQFKDMLNKILLELSGRATKQKG